MQSGKDQTAHTKLKYRQTGQNAPTELKNHDYKTELQKKESKVISTSTDSPRKMITNNSMATSDQGQAEKPLLLANVPHVNEEVIKKYDDKDANGDDDDDFDSSR